MAPEANLGLAPEPSDLEPPLVPPADTPAAESPEAPGTEQTLKGLPEALQYHRVVGIYHSPETGFYLEMFSMTQKGPKPFEP